MRTVLRLLGSRYGIALVLVVIVVGVVAAGRTFISDRDALQNDTVGPTVGPVSSEPPLVDPALGDDSVAEPSATPSPAFSGGDATTVATRFATAWLRRPGITAAQWRASLTPHATPELMQLLEDSDPADVPTTKITGSVEVAAVGADAEAKIPAEGGVIRLELEIVKGRWQVNSLDWEAA